MIQLKIWVLCVLIILAIIGFFVVCWFIWFEVIERLLDIIWNYKKYKKFYYENNSFSEFLNSINKTRKKLNKERVK